MFSMLKLKELGIPAVIVIVLTFLIFAISKFLEIKEFRRKTTKDQIDALAGLDLLDKKKENRFVVEQIFSYKFNMIIPYAAIDILIGATNPSTAINHYIKGKYYLSIDKSNNTLGFRQKYETVGKRKSQKWLFMIGYFSFGIGIAPLAPLASMFVKNNDFKSIIALTPFIFVFVFFAYACLDGYKRIKAAEQVMEQI